MKLLPLIADKWKMDGGVAFGEIPQEIWREFFLPDDNNMIDICTRCLLIDAGDELVLIDTGMGRKQGEKYYSYRFVAPGFDIVNSLEECGYKASDITKVIFTHLHDDHCGGAVELDNGEYRLVFPNAKHYCSERQFLRASNPNPREAAAFFPENLQSIQDMGLLSLIGENEKICEGLSFREYHGHTAGQLIPFINYKGKTVVFAADFIPSYAHIPLLNEASVDTEPLLTLSEKEAFLEEAVRDNYILVFQHDPLSEATTVCRDGDNYRGGEVKSLEDFL